MSSSAVLKEKVYTKQGITYKTLFKVIYYIMTVLMKKSSECFFSISLEPIQSEKERNWNLALHAPKMLNVTLPLIVMWKI